MSTYFLKIFRKEEERKKSPAKVEVNFIRALSSATVHFLGFLTRKKSKSEGVGYFFPIP